MHHLQGSHQPKNVVHNVFVFKDLVSRVGIGLLAGELPSDKAEKRGWTKHGTVSGRLRRVAPFDFNFSGDSIKLNAPTDIVITKLDVIYLMR